MSSDRESGYKDLDFRQHYLITSLSGTRIAMIVTIILFAVFFTLNKIFFPFSLEPLFFERFGVIIPVLVLTLIVSLIPRLRNQLNLYFILLNIMVAGAIFYVGITSGPSVAGYQYYFVWVMVVIIGLFIFYRLPFVTLVILGLLQLIAFILSTALNGTLQEMPFVFVNDLFYVVSIYSIGFMMAFMFRQINMKDYLHQKVILENNRLLRHEIAERKLTAEALLQSERQYQHTLDSIPDWIYVVDREHKVVMFNSSLQEITVRDNQPAEILGKPVDEVYPFVADFTKDELDLVFSSGEMLVRDHVINVMGRMAAFEIRRVPVFKDGLVAQVLTILRDRSKEKEVEELKQKNTEQKEILLREIHHRVKNNLAIVISLLNLQLRKSTDPGFHRIIHDIEMRIRSMALLHEHLYRSENLDKIHLAGYLRSLSSIVLSTISGHRVRLHLNLEECDSTIETALPIGLIVNELLTNSIKYAFPDQGEGDITLSLNKEENQMYALMVGDNGIGLPAGFNLDTEDSLGMFIVKLLVEQLDGTITINSQDGSTFIIRFPIVNQEHKKYK